MLRIARYAALAALAGGVAACATTPPLPPVLTYARTDCHATPDLSSAIGLTPTKETNGHSVTTVVGPETDCVVGDRGPTPYVLYALPADNGDKTLAVGGLLEATRILSPEVSILDAQGQVTRTFAPADYYFRGPVYSVQFRPRAGDAFVLVTSDASRVGEQYDAINIGTTTTVVSTGLYAAAITIGQEAQTSRAFSHEGTVQVIVYDSDTKED